MGDTVHMAVGRAYDDTVGEGNEQNDSAVHVDMIVDMSEGSFIEVDGERVQEDGTFVLKTARSERSDDLESERRALRAVVCGGSSGRKRRNPCGPPATRERTTATNGITRTAVRQYRRDRARPAVTPVRRHSSPSELSSDWIRRYTLASSGGIRYHDSSRRVRRLHAVAESGRTRVRDLSGRGNRPVARRRGSERIDDRRHRSREGVSQRPSGRDRREGFDEVPEFENPTTSRSGPR